MNKIIFNFRREQYDIFLFYLCELVEDLVSIVSKGSKYGIRLLGLLLK